jgi:hypothetical protein
VRKFVVVAVIAGSLVGSTTVTWAEDIVAYQADGEADAAASDAQVAALDEAYANAVAQAVGELVDPEVRRQSKPVINRELIGHARLWVAGYKVTRTGVDGGRKQLSVTVRIDRDKLRARLAELNIAIRDPGQEPVRADRQRPRDPGEPPAAGAQTVTVLLRVATPAGVHATYGLAAENDVAGFAALSGALRRANLVVKRAPAAGPAARADGELPLDDATADALASETKADLVAIAGVTVGAPLPLRGIDAAGVLVTAHVRLFDRKAHRSLGQGGVVTAARGSDPGVVGYAIDHALLAAAADVLPSIQAPGAQSAAQPPVFSGDDRPLGEPGVVLVRLAKDTPWGLVQSELKYLLGARGVSRATLRRVSPAGWVIGIATGESIDRIASMVKKPPPGVASVSVKIVGDLIEATLSGAP